MLAVLLWILIVLEFLVLLRHVENPNPSAHQFTNNQLAHWTQIGLSGVYFVALVRLLSWQKSAFYVVCCAAIAVTALNLFHGVRFAWEGLVPPLLLFLAFQLGRPKGWVQLR